ncbi:ubiquitin-like protein [Tubulinosema ratisbonensis]|uniref:Ubiquitin-like protein n=1 Tax=Tubulinosema ratisbonensis TaxID=291195 RepID=A0A437AHJ9_9MICR|nr:ubiquitin-like protein [Tubulinosema ratisbonensis]
MTKDLEEKSISNNYEESNNENEETKSINLTIKEQDGPSIKFKTKSNVTFGRILDSFAKETGRSKNDMRLIYKGKIVGHGVTPFDLRLNDDDELEVVASQTGGF